MPAQRHLHALGSAMCLIATAIYTPVAMAASYELRIYSDDMPTKGEAEIEFIMSAAKPKPSPSRARTGRTGV